MEIAKRGRGKAKAKGKGTDNYVVPVAPLDWERVFDLDEDELIALLARWDQAKDGYIDYEDFVGTIFG